MNISVNPNGFSELNTVVLYQFSSFVPLPEDCIGRSVEDLSGFTGSNVLWRGSSDGIGLADYLEYNLSYDIKKSEFASEILPNLYAPNSLRFIFTADGVPSVGSSLVPSVIVSTAELDPQWFGSCMINDKTVIVVPAIGGIWKIEFYEESGITTNHQVPGISAPWILYSAMEAYGKESFATVTPAVTITLGPDPGSSFNPNSYYLDYDSRRGSSDRENITTLREWGTLAEEITAQKAVVVAVSQNSSNPEVNLAYKSWNISTNPNRNMYREFLRNDRFQGMKSLKVVEEKEKDSGVLLDSRSGIILGTSQLLDTASPVLFRRLGKTKNLLIEEGIYSPYRCYNLGDQVLFGGEVWESLENQNLGNTPSLSPLWSLANQLENIFTSRVLIQVEDTKAGNIIPGGNITIEDPTDTKIFEVIENLGYKLSPTQPAYTNPGEYIKDYRITESSENSKVVKRISIWGWEEAINNGHLTFHFEEVGSSVKFLLRYNGVDYSYTDWARIFNEARLNITSTQNPIYLNCVGDTISSRRNFFPVDGECVAENIPINNFLEFIFPELEKYQPTQLKMINTAGEDSYVSEIYPELDSTRGYTFDGVSDFSNGIWILELINKLLEINANGQGFEFNTPRGIVPYSSTEYNLEFYCTDPVLRSSDWEVYINNRVIVFGGSLNFSTSTVQYTLKPGESDIYSLKWSGQIKENFNILIKKIEK